MNTDKLQVRALKTIQSEDTALYAFFIPGELIMEIADISRIARDENDKLEGFQRKAIQQHVKSIADYLDQGKVIFPNSIILAFSPEVQFRQSRGREPEGTINSGQIGTLEIPIRKKGDRVAWIVDGQQRSIALSQAKNKGINVPVVAFVTSDLETQRKQFILVNKARPLPSRLINELLPEVDTYIPRDLSTRKIPSELCALLNRDPESPFHHLIKRLSQDKKSTSIIIDSAIIEMIKNSIRSPLGVLSQFKSFGSEPSDIDGMYKVLVTYWSAVKTVFPEAWGVPINQSRLMHSAGIVAMGTLMDKIMNRSSGYKSSENHVLDSLKNIAPYCHWTSGTWKHINMEWNQIQKTGKDVRLLSEVLTHLDYEMTVLKGK